MFADSDTTFSRHSSIAEPSNGIATIRMTMPESLLGTSTLSVSLVRSRVGNDGKRHFKSGAQLYLIQLPEFATGAIDVTHAPHASAIRKLLVPAPPAITVAPIGRTPAVAPESAN